MPSYQFSINSGSNMTRAGIVRSETFEGALEAIDDQMEPAAGDTLQIGVRGFPPAHFECVWSVEDGVRSWMPARALAA
jgi:hypothetical protein